MFTLPQDVSESELTYPLNTMKGFISEGANIILQRVMCQRQDVPEKAIFLALDNSFCLSTMKYVSIIFPFYLLPFFISSRFRKWKIVKNETLFPFFVSALMFWYICFVASCLHYILCIFHFAHFFLKRTKRNDHFK